MQTSQTPNSRSIIETVLLLLLLLALLFAMYEALRAFFGILAFALIFAVSFSGLFEKFAHMLGNRRKLAAVIYCFVLAAIVALPFIYIISALSHHVKDLLTWITEARINGLPPLPPWASGIPFAGEEIVSFWQQLGEKPKDMLALHEQQIKMALHTILTGGAGIVGATMEIVIGVIISSVFLVGGEKMLRPFHAATGHLLGEKDAKALSAAAVKAIRGVSVGVMGTAFIASVISWIGLVIAGVPFAIGIAALVFFLTLIQVGPTIIWVILTIWAVVQGNTGWAIFFAAYGTMLMAVDAVLKPALIAKSGKLPFLVLFLGVVGGMIAWGFTGMFKGAIILAVFYTVFNSWLEQKNNPETSAYGA